MGFEGDLSNLGVGEVLHSIHQSGLTGTLSVEKDGAVGRLVTVDGFLVGFAPGPDKDPPKLEDLIRKQQALEEKDLERILKRKGRRALRTVLRDKGLLDDDAQRDIVRRYTESSVLEVFHWETGRFRFDEKEAPDQVLSQDLWHLRSVIDPNAILMEAARRSDEWKRIKLKVPSFKEVFVPEHEAAPEEEDEALDEVQHRVLSLLDGWRDLETVTDALPYDRFTVAEATAELTQSGRIKRVDAPELRRRAVELAQDGDLDGASKLLKRSLELEPGARSARFELADLLVRLERRSEAAEELKQLAFQAREDGEVDVALEAYDRAAELVLSDVGVKEARFKLLREAGRDPGEVAGAGRSLAEALIQQALHERAIPLLQELIALGSEDRTALRDVLAEAYVKKGDREAAVSVYRQEAEDQLAVGDEESALAAWCRVVHLDPENDLACREVERLEQGFYRRRKRRLKRLRNRALLALLALLVIVQLGREVTAVVRVRGVLGRADEGELAKAEVPAALEAVRASLPFTLAGSQAARVGTLLAGVAREPEPETEPTRVYRRPATGDPAALAPPAARRPEPRPAPPSAAERRGPLVQLSASSVRARFGIPVEVRAVTVGVDGPLRYRWSCAEGSLSHDLTAASSVRWLPPYAPPGSAPRAIKVRVAVERAGWAPLEAEIALTLDAYALPKSPAYRASRAVGVQPTRFGRMLDVAFDPDDRAVLLVESGAGGRRLLALDADWEPTPSPPGREPPVRFDRIVAARTAVYGLEMEGRRVVRVTRHPHAGDPVPYGGPGRGNGRFGAPVDLGVDALGRVYVLDAADPPAVHVFEPEGGHLFTIGVEGDAEGQLRRPVAMALASDGALYVLDDGRKRVLVYEDLVFAREIAVGARTDRLVDVKVDPITTRVCVLESSTGRVRSFASDGTPLGSFGRVSSERTLGAFRRPYRLRFDGSGHLYLLGEDGDVLHRLDPALGGEVARWGGPPFTEATRIAVGPRGDVAALLGGERLAVVLDPRGWVSRVIPLRGTVDEAVDLALDDGGKLFVLDKEGGKVHVFAPDGRHERTLSRPGDEPRELSEPVSLAFDPARFVLTIVDNRDQWGLHLIDTDGHDLAAFPGREDVLDDARAAVLTADGTVHVSCGERGVIKRFGLGERMTKMETTWIEASGRNDAYRGDWSAGGGPVVRLTVSNLGHLIVVQKNAGVQAVDLSKGTLPVARVAAGAGLESISDAAVDAYDRLYILDPRQGRVVVYAREYD